MASTMTFCVGRGRSRTNGLGLTRKGPLVQIQYRPPVGEGRGRKTGPFVIHIAARIRSRGRMAGALAGLDRPRNGPSEHRRSAPRQAACLWRPSAEGSIWSTRRIIQRKVAPVQDRGIRRVIIMIIILLRTPGTAFGRLPRADNPARATS